MTQTRSSVARNHVTNNLEKCSAGATLLFLIHPPRAKKPPDVPDSMATNCLRPQPWSSERRGGKKKGKLYWKVSHLSSYFFSPRVAQTRCVKWELPGCDFSRKHPLAIVCPVNFCRPQRPDFHTWEIKGYQGAFQRGGLNVRGDKPVHKMLISFAC